MWLTAGIFSFGFGLFLFRLGTLFFVTVSAMITRCLISESCPSSREKSVHILSD